MKKELALQLIQEALPVLLDDENAAASLFRDLQFLSSYKYNSYEMYHPGRLFLESLYLWLNQFQLDERMDALNFVREKLIFISRQEFQQLAGLLYYDIIRRQQIRVAAEVSGIPRHKIRVIRESESFRKISRASLYVGMSDGARIDYIRRQNLEIGNEQVLPYYEISPAKKIDLLKELHKDLNDANAQFQCLFLIDDFSGSGRTLLREVVVDDVEKPFEAPIIPTSWQSKYRFTKETNELELNFQSSFSEEEQEELLSMGTTPNYIKAVRRILYKCFTHETKLKGSLNKVAKSDGLSDLLEPNGFVYYCPLLATERALDRLRPLVNRLPGRFGRTQILPGALLKNTESITSKESRIGALCDKYYTNDLEDQHTGSVKYGFDNCGLPLVLHHNTPNNSIYLLWARKHAGFNPLFVRYERHGREVS